MKKVFFTSESVTEGHPDKICDQISDAVLDVVLEQDDNSRVACETVITTGMVMCIGEITTKAKVEIPKIARTVIADVGYDRSNYGFDFHTCAVLTNINEQSPDIAIGVNRAYDYEKSENYSLSFGAGDQGIIFGYACNETPELMPLPISLAHKLVLRLSEVRKDGTLDYLRPDGKSQVTVEYHDNTPIRVEAVIVSSQHSADISLSQLRRDVMDYVIYHSIPAKFIDENTKLYINPTGRFVIGGPQGDSGLTGRKIIVDTYGGYARHGGGALSGKDPTKVDRSAAYASRYIAKNIVAAGFADKCEIQISYAIGVTKPISILIDTFGTGKVEDKDLLKAVSEVFSLRPSDIIKMLDLRKPQYRQLAAYGHMGREDLNVAWEKTDRIDELKKVLI